MRKQYLAGVLALLVAGCAAATTAGIGNPGSAPAPASAPAREPAEVPALSTLPAAAGGLPRVRLVATGGTISNRRGGRLTAEELLAAVPGLDTIATVHAEQFANTASSAITLGQWLALARRVEALFREDAGLSGIVVASGTDTLEELAYFLHLTVRDRRPVVVTGSMRNPSQVGYEGSANLLAAIRVAATPAAAGRGALVVLNDEINGARDVTKTDALRLQTFASRGFGALGVVDSDRVVFRRTAEGRHTATSEFDLDRIETLPRVDVLLVYQGATGDLLKAAIDLGARGLVLATAGAGALSGTQADGLAYARAKGVPVVTTTRAGTGRIAPPTRPANADATATPSTPWPRLAAGDLAAVKARVLLMLALTRTTDPRELQRILDEY